MSWLEEKRGDLAGETVWIIGTHPILMKYDDNFFAGKISIALNFAFVAFPKSTYICAFHRNVLDPIIRYKPELLEKCILHWPLEMPDALKRFGKYKDSPVYMKAATTHTPANLVSSVEAIRQKKSTRYFGLSSILHFAIQAAAVLGAKRILLVACIHKTKLERHHAQSRGMWLFYPDVQMGPTPRQKEHQLGTLTLAQALGRHGIEVLRHYPPPRGRLEEVSINAGW